MGRFFGLLVTLLIAAGILVVAFIVAENFFIHIFIGLVAIIMFGYLVISLADQIESPPAVPELQQDLKQKADERAKKNSPLKPQERKGYGGLPDSESPVVIERGLGSNEEPIAEPESEEAVEDLIDYYGRSRVDDFVTDEEKSDVPEWVLDAADDDDQIRDWFPTTGGGELDEAEEEADDVIVFGDTEPVSGEREEEKKEVRDDAGDEVTFGLEGAEAEPEMPNWFEDAPPDDDGTVAEWYTDSDGFEDVELPPEESTPGSTVSPPPPPKQPPVPPSEDKPVLTRARDHSGQPMGQQVHFKAFYPKEIKPDDWQPLHAYVYKKFVEDKVLNDVREELGERIAAFRQSGSPSRQEVAKGAMIVATPKLDGFQFNPPMVAIGFYKDWHRLDFEMRATDAPLYQASNGQLVFTVEGIIVAEIPLSVYVSDEAFSGETQQVTQKIYEAVFASYSHRDTTIVARVERAVKALGLDYLRDVTSLKSGQHWSEELLELIERADIFQLFWSPNAAQSEYVRQEYEHALKLARDADSFVRPVYWQIPMADPPGALKHLHFAYQPDLAED